MCVFENAIGPDVLKDLSENTRSGMVSAPVSKIQRIQFPINRLVNAAASFELTWKPFTRYLNLRRPAGVAEFDFREIVLFVIQPGFVGSSSGMNDRIRLLVYLTPVANGKGGIQVILKDKTTPVLCHPRPGDLCILDRGVSYQFAPNTSSIPHYVFVVTYDESDSSPFTI
jgi:hypothetical protein